MMTNCAYCKTEINVKPSKLKAKNYCDKRCWHRDKVQEGTCPTCGKTVVRLKVQSCAQMFCNMTCAKVFTSRRMTEMNLELNPERMVLPTREKLRNHRLNKGTGKSYTKTFGRHTHRIVAEEKLGRPLTPKEVVHHEDENKRNNDPDNLIVFSSQAAHARHHMLKNIHRNA